MSHNHKKEKQLQAQKEKKMLEKQQKQEMLLGQHKQKVVQVSESKIKPKGS